MIKKFQNLLDILRSKRKSYKQMMSDNNIQIDKCNLKYIDLNIQGKNNTIIIEGKINAGKHSKLVIEILGDNNSFIIKEGFYLIETMNIMIPSGVTNSRFFMDERASVMSLSYTTINSNTYCEIGKDCMFGRGVLLFNTDAHPILDINTGEVVNKVKGITIKDHCWIGIDAKIMKNSIVPEDSIVGYSAVFAGEKYKDSPHCAFAGNPAKPVKENVTWEKDCNKFGYIENVL